jgi:hypothetical protein
MRTALFLATLLQLVWAPVISSQPQVTWTLAFSDSFDAPSLRAEWASWVVDGDPCGFVRVEGGQLRLRSQCNCGTLDPSGADAQLLMPIPRDFRIVYRLNKAQCKSRCSRGDAMLQERIQRLTKEAPDV